MAIEPITAGLELVNTVVKRVFPDATEKEMQRVALEMRELELKDKQLERENDIDKGQLEINKVEAANNNWFVSGWRPATGWICVAGLFYQVIIRPMIGWLMVNLAGWSLPPSLEVDTLMTILFGMLGLGAYRTKEKLSGVARL